MMLAVLVTSGCASMFGSLGPGMTRSIRYDARVLGPSPWTAEVSATFEGGASALIAGAPAGVVSMVVEDSAGTRAAQPVASPSGVPGAWTIGCADTCRVRYRYNFSRAAELSEDGLDAAIARSPDALAPAHAWLLRPSMLMVDVPVSIVVRTDPDVKLATALRPGAVEGIANPSVRSFSLVSQELVSAGYMAFGSFTEMHAGATGASLSVAVLRGDRAAGDDVIRRWIARTARTMDQVFGRFPLRKAHIFVVPSPGSSDVELGRTLATGGGTVAVVLGAGADEDRLRRDWILTHEFFHLGVPSFRRDGRWLDEGLATYYEPVLRARAGLLAPLTLWTELEEGLRRGVADPEELSLIHTERHERIYWGGAMFALEADVLIRSLTQGARSLDDGIRGALERGANATQIWTVQEYLDALDAGVGLDVLRALREVAASRGRAPACAADIEPSVDHPDDPERQARPDRPVRPWATLLSMAVGTRTASEVEQAALGYSPSPECALSEQAVLKGLLRSLGVTRSRSGAVALMNAAPLSSIRRRVSASWRGPFWDPPRVATRSARALPCPDDARLCDPLRHEGRGQ